MTPRSRTYRSLCVALAALAGHAWAQPMQSVWQATSGRRPDEVCPAWRLVNSASGHPVFDGEKMVLTTTAPATDMFYVQTTALESPLPDPIVVDGTVRFISGSSSVGNRGPVAIAITTAANMGTLVFVGDGDVFVTAAGDVRGQSAAVDTTATAHTYHVEVTAAGAVSVRYDGTPMLTGATYTSAEAFGPAPRILWGEGSKFASGKEAWISFAHNAAVCKTTTPTTSDSSTTTSTLPPQCNGMAPGSLAAVRCHLEVLGGQIASDTSLGSFGSRLGRALDRAVALARQGDDACAADDGTTARRRMKQTQRLLQGMAHRLSGLTARRRLDGTMRSSLVATIRGIRVEVAALRPSPCS
jgi:hypothetical protein